MNLKEEFLTALQSGEEHDALLELVRRHHAQGMTVEEAYEVL